jgi:hypothetical protein
MPAVACADLISNAAFSAAASSLDLKFLRTRTPLIEPVTLHAVTPLRFPNRAMANNVSWDM